MSEYTLEVEQPERQHVLAAIRYAKAEASESGDRETHDRLSEAREAVTETPADTDTALVSLSTEQIEALSDATADYAIDVLEGSEPPEFSNVATRIYRYVEHGPDYDPNNDTGMRSTDAETGDDGRSLLRVEFGGRPAAKKAREEYAEHVAEEDDRRFKTVVFEDAGLSPTTVDAIKADADEGLAASETRSHSEPLTDRERKKIKEAGGFSQTVTTANWRSAKGTFTANGMGDRFRDAIGSLTDGDDPAELAQSWIEQAKQGGNDGDSRAVSGGARDDGEQDIIDRQRQQAAAQVVMSEEYANARRWCKKGDEDACDALVEEFDISREEAMKMLGMSTDEPDTSETTEQTELVTVGGDGDFPEMQITKAAAGALRDSWTSYKAATGAIEDAIETLREEVGRGRRSMNAINAIREAGGQDDIEAEKLGTLLGRLAEMPGNIPQVATLAEYGIFDKAGYADNSRQPPLDADTTAVDPRGRLPNTGMDGSENSDTGAWRPEANGYGVAGASSKAIRIHDTGKPGVHHVQLVPETGSSLTVAMNLRLPQAQEVANRLANGVKPALIGHGGDRLTRAVRGAMSGAPQPLKDSLTDRFAPRSAPLDADPVDVRDMKATETDDSDLVEVRSPYRPLPRAARKMLSQDFGGVKELEPDEGHRGGGYLVMERPPQDFLDRFELKVIRDPAVSYQTDGGDVVDIYADPDRVIAGGTETNLTALEAVKNAESEDRFTLTAGDPENVPGWPENRTLPLDVDTTAADPRGDREFFAIHPEGAASGIRGPFDTRTAAESIAPHWRVEADANRDGTRSTPLDVSEFDARPARRRRRQHEQDARNAKRFKDARRMMPETSAYEATDRAATLRQGDSYELSQDGSRRLSDVADTPERERQYVNAIRKAEAREDWERVRRLEQRRRARLDYDPVPLSDLRRERFDVTPASMAELPDVDEAATQQISDSFSVEQQQTFDGPEPEQEAQNQQVTLTGSPEGTDDALPADWSTDYLGEEYTAGPLTLRVIGSGEFEGETPVSVDLYDNSGNRFTVASGIKTRSRAVDIAANFAEAVAPDDVDFSKGSSVLPEAAAQAKRDASAGDDEGLGRFN